MQTVRALRTVLYMPGSNARALDKARSLDCDGIILDLEDAVAPEAKANARTQIAEAVKGGGYGRRMLILRVNGSDTEHYADDMELAAALAVDAVLLPKVNGPQDVVNARKLLPKVALWAMMETPLAMLMAREIAAHGQENGVGLSGFVMGTNDLSKDTGARLVPGRAPMVPWLSTCVAAARAHGLIILDGVYNTLDDMTGFATECEQARDMGFDGKTLVHPRQIAPCNAIFSPDPEEVAFARLVIEAFGKPENASKGAIRVDGKMVERLHADMAAKTVAKADAIGGEQTR